MNNESKRPNEIKMLSAYLDNELSIARRQSLEKRLQNEPDLRRKLEDLRKTKMALGSLARVHAPRNFTLTPDMVKVRRKKQVPWFSTLKLATSLAAVLLVALFSFELILQQGFLGVARTSMEDGAQTESLKTMDEETPPPLIFWSEPGIGGGGEAEDMPEDSEIVTAPQVDPDRSPEESPVEEEPTGEEVPKDSPPVELAPPSEEEASDMQAQSTTPQDDNLILGLNPDSGGEIIEQSESAEAPSRASRVVLDLFNWLQIGLALFVLFSGITLWILRSKQIF